MGIVTAIGSIAEFIFAISVVTAISIALVIVIALLMAAVIQRFKDHW
jgi:hypothetical protein